MGKYELSMAMKKYINSYDSGGGYKVSNGNLVMNRTIACSKTTREGNTRADTSDYLFMGDREMEENVNVANVDLTQYRIRKLTPKECFRLMGVRDEDYEKIKIRQSDSSLYHLAGDSIVVDVISAIFKELL